jgi:DNA-binding CsgD family transcriptional regulator/tetratricopeptide (TPR) repeat protein
VSAPSLLEREHEIRVIDELLREAAAGRGGLALIEGPAGIGKSALLARARELALEHGLAVASARGSELERADPFGVVRQLFEPRLRAMSGAARERALGGAAALAAPVVLPETGSAGAGDGSSFGTLHGLYWLLAGFAANRPQLLVVDDLHWADEASARFLLYLANRLEESPVLLLAAQRPEGDALRAAPGLVLVTPGALSTEATSLALAGGEADGVAPAFASAVHAATGGNPLLVRRLADGLRERGVPFTETGADEIASAGPDVVAGAVAVAMARLGREPVELARAVAILGDEAPLALAAPLAGLAPGEGATAADQLVRAGILDDGRPLRFQHALVRDAVLASLTAGEQAAAHRAAALRLAEQGAPERAVAAHLLHTEPSGDARVAATLAAEGRRALAAGASSEARGLLERPLAEPPAETDRHALLLALARAAAQLGAGDAIEHVHAAYDAAGDGIERAQAALAVMWATGPAPDQVERATGLIEPAIAGLGGGDRELELQLEAARLMMLFLSEDRITAWIAESERHAALAGETPGECLLLLHASIARFASGRPAAEIAGPVERIPDNAVALAALGPEAPWVPFLIGMLFKTDRLEAADVVTAAALAEATRTGSAAGFAIASIWHAWIALRRGQGEAAEAHARAAVDAAPPDGWQYGFCSAGLAEVLAERLQLDEAARVLEAVRMEQTAAADRSSELLFSTRSIVRMAQGDVADALEDQREARRRRGDETQMDPDFAGWVRFARLLHAAGDAAGAREEAAASLAYARRFGTPGYIGQALTVSGVLAGGAAGLDQLHEAVAELERSPARRELARALVELGGALRRAGQRVAAREPLRRALDIAAGGGLTATAGHAREELRATGARVHRDHATGAASLTPSERRIAERAAAGASNPEIAQALFVTTKTVEMHLSRVYRKLDIGSRDQLPAALAG